MNYKNSVIYFCFIVLFSIGCSHELDLMMSAPVPAKIVFSEILYDPLGDNSGHQKIEIKNVGTESMTLDEWWLCARQDYAAIPPVTLDGGSILVIHVGATGTNTSSDVFLPFMLPLQAISDLNLYEDSNFSSPESMVHFVQWGGVPPTSRQFEAVIKGLWTAGDFIPAVPEGHSIEYDGAGNSSSDWFDQSEPNLGS